MDAMGKLTPLSPYFNHGTIIRTGIIFRICPISSYYIPMFLILLFFPSLNSKSYKSKVL